MGKRGWSEGKYASMRILRPSVWVLLHGAESIAVLICSIHHTPAKNFNRTHSQQEAIGFDSSLQSNRVLVGPPVI